MAGFIRLAPHIPTPTGMDYLRRATVGRATGEGQYKVNQGCGDAPNRMQPKDPMQTHSHLHVVHYRRKGDGECWCCYLLGILANGLWCDVLWPSGFFLSNLWVFLSEGHWPWFGWSTSGQVYVVLCLFQWPLRHPCSWLFKGNLARLIHLKFIVVQWVLSFMTFRRWRKSF
jgi:hypothetical protein